MGELVGAISGIGEASRALAFPVVSGNVSLYNESMGTSIPPTPAIGGVGLIEDATRFATLAFKAGGETVLLAGAPPAWGTHLGQSVYLREIHGREDGPPPPVDLGREKQAGDFVRALIRDGIASAVHDLSDGGLAVAVAEMTMASGIGATVDAPPGDYPVASWFGEDQGRYLLTVRPADLAEIEARAAKAGVPLVGLGTTGGTELKLGAAAAISVAKLREAHEAWFPAFMFGAAPATP
jgi:phosphoribosylformylglycinamidine synthase